MARAGFFHERIDIVLSGKEAKRLPRVLLEGIGAQVLVMGGRKPFEVAAVSAGGVHINNGSLSVFSSGAFDAIGFTIALLNLKKRWSMESLVYHRSGPGPGPGPGDREFRAALTRLRAAFADRLGPAVVAGSTAMFYSSKGSVRVPFRTEILRMTATTEWRDEDGRRLLQALGFAGLFAGHEKLVSRSTLPARSVVASKNGELVSLRFTRVKKRAGIGHVCFEFSGKIRPVILRKIERFLASESLDGVTLEVLHGRGARGLPDLGLGSGWRTSALGAVEAISVLEIRPVAALAS